MSDRRTQDRYLWLQRLLGPVAQAAGLHRLDLLPFVGIFFSNLPALDAQTRLLTGRYLEYRSLR